MYLSDNVCAGICVILIFIRIIMLQLSGNMSELISGSILNFSFVWFMYSAFPFIFTPYNAVTYESLQ